jgi:hypothetical protein
MEPTTKQRTIDVTGLPEEAIVAVETLVSVIRAKVEVAHDKPIFGSRDEWSRALREWAASHPPLSYTADDSRESIYEGCGE